MTPLDVRLFVRTASASVLLLAVAALVAAATDEPSSTWLDRLARLAALAPALGALSVSLVHAQLGRRAETVALAAVGCPPQRAIAGAVAGAASVALLASVALGASRGPLSSLFPALASSPWAPAPGGFVALAHGVSLDAASGAARFFPASPSGNTPVARPAVALALALASLVAPAWVALPCPTSARVAVGVAAVCLALVAFHGVAAGAPALLLAAPSLLLAAHASLAWRLSIPS
jgi:hypothetical protein